MRFRPGGFEKERELTVEFRRWKRRFVEDTASRVGFARGVAHALDEPRRSPQTCRRRLLPKLSSRARRAFC